MGLAPVVALLAAAAAVVAGRSRRAPVAAAVAAVAAWEPVAVPLGVVGVLAGRVAAGLRRRRERRRGEARADADVVVLAELIGLGISAGLTLPEAMRTAAPALERPLADEVHRVLRRAAVAGISPAFEGAGGRIGELCRLTARALATGAPLGDAVAGFAAAARDRERSVRLAAARRLPVLLLVPLALLILPGFVLITAGPALLGGLARLGL